MLHDSTNLASLNGSVAIHLVCSRPLDLDGGP
jgi:hypothetical protein